MSILDRFRREWAAEFPSNAAPQLACLIPSTARSMSVCPAVATGSTKIKSGLAVLEAVAAWEAVTVTSTSPAKTGSCTVKSQSEGNNSSVESLNREAIERTMKTFQSNVERLKRELDQHRFVVHFLRNLLGVDADDETAALVETRLPVPAYSDVERGDRGEVTSHRIDGLSSSVDCRRSKSTPLLPTSTSAAHAADASPVQPVPPARHRRKAVRDRNLPPTDTPLNSGVAPRSWRTSIYEEVIPYDPSLQNQLDDQCLERHFDGRQRPSYSSSSSISSESTSSSANSYTLTHGQNDDARSGTGNDVSQKRRPSGPLMRSGREALRGRMRTWHTIFDDGGGGGSDDNGVDAEVEVAGVPPVGGRRFSIVPRPRPITDDDGDDDDDDVDDEPPDADVNVQETTLSPQSPSKNQSGFNKMADRRSSLTVPMETAGGATGKRSSRSSKMLVIDFDGSIDNVIVSLPPGSSTSARRDEEKLQMRQWVVKSILESEQAYLAMLDILIQLAKTFRNMLHAEAELAVLSSSEIDAIFCCVPELHSAHDLFVSQLKPLVESWTDGAKVAEPVKMLALMEYRVASEYINNYENAVSTIRQCWQKNTSFAEQTKAIHVAGSRDKMSLEQMLHTPVVRFQRNALVLHDLINCTPTGHPDYDTLQKTLIIARQFLENFEERSDGNTNMKVQRYLVKRGLVVEKIGDSRKLRQLLLFNDLLVCAVQKVSLKGHVHFEAKWSIGLLEVTLEDRVNIKEEQLLAASSQQELKQLQQIVSELQSELRSQLRQQTNEQTSRGRKRQNSFGGRRKAISKLKKRLAEQQEAVIKASPNLLFRLHDRRHGRQHTLLMASDYERAIWRTAIVNLLSRVQSAPNISSAELQSLLDFQKLPPFIAVSSHEDIVEDDLLFGILNITVGKVNGVKRPTGLFCTIEVDSFGHFATKAKTTTMMTTETPTWNEDFDIELLGAQTVRILINQTDEGASGSNLIGMCSMELTKELLTAQLHEKTVSINNEVSLAITMSFCSTSHERSLGKMAVRTSPQGSLFGANIDTAERHETHDMVPTIVVACIQEVEARGMKEEGLYRISGATSEIQKLKKAFEKNSKQAPQLMKSADISSITALLKLYLRQLPEPLFTCNFYQEFVNAMSLTNPEAKEKYVILLLKSIREPNRSTARYLVDHLLRVAKYEDDNRMSIQNLATVFGPTILRPPDDEPTAKTIEQMFTSGAHEVVMQTTMLLAVFGLRKRGVSF